jgi:hypothetical protein
MPRNTIAAIWIAGIVLAVLIYVAGPERFVFAAYELIQRAWWGVQEVLRDLSLAAFDFVRALAIGLYFVFLALGVLAVSRGGRGWVALVVVSLLFLGLVWHDYGTGFGSRTRWGAALVLVGVGALSMTRRLTHPEIADARRPGQVPPHREP